MRGTFSFTADSRSWKASALKTTRQPIRRAAARSFSWSESGDGVSEEARESGVTTEDSGGLVKCPTNDAGSSDNAVDPFKFQRQQAQVIGELLNSSLAQCLAVEDPIAGAVQEPLEIESVFEFVLDVVDMPEIVGIEDADAGDGVGEVGQSVVELVEQVGVAGLPLAFEQDEFAGRQFVADVGRVAAAASFGAGGDAALPEELSEQRVDGFLAGGLGGHGSDCRTGGAPPLCLRHLPPRSAGGEGSRAGSCVKWELGTGSCVKQELGGHSAGSRPMDWARVAKGGGGLLDGVLDSLLPELGDRGQLVGAEAVLGRVVGVGPIDDGVHRRPDIGGTGPRSS